MAETKIEWTVTIGPDGVKHKGFTFNPWVGCTKVSPACDNCYAESWAKRAGDPQLWQGERRRTTVANWNKPLKWNRLAESLGVRLKVFCASLADVFDNKVPAEWRDDLWALIRATPHLDWLLLTKRPQNIAKMLPPDWKGGYANVWLGTTVENQEEADRRLPVFLGVSALVHFLSMEPLLGAVNLREIAWPKSWPRCDCENHGPTIDAFSGTVYCEGCCEGPEVMNLALLGWVIAGGESGAHVRDPGDHLFYDLRDQCAAMEAPFFMKQMPNKAPIPDDLLVRQFPRAA